MTDLFPRNPNYYLANFALEKIKTSGIQGNILLFGAENGRNTEFLANSLLQRWNNPNYKIYVVDDFNDKFGRQRMASFIDNTQDVRNWFVHYTSNDLSKIFDNTYAFTVFITPHSSGEIYQLSEQIWNNLIYGGYFLYLNYEVGQTKYMGDLERYPHEGIKRFFRNYSNFASDIGNTPHPYIGK